MNKSVLMIMYGKGVGGAELQFIELANFLSQHYRIRFVSLGGGGAVESMPLDAKIELLVYPYRTRLSASLGLIRALLGSILFSADVVVTTSHVANVLGCARSFLRRSSLISLQTVSRCSGREFLDRLVLRRFDVLVAGADDIRQYLISHRQQKERIQVVQNWVDFSKRSVQSSAADTKRDFNLTGKHVIGCVGRMHIQKGQIYLVQAFPSVLAQMPKCRLLLVGDGPTKTMVLSEVEKLGLTEYTIIPGTVTGTEYNDLLNVIDIYVQPSLFEGLPRTLLDAMYLAKPIVATDVNGNREAIVDESNGVLVPPKNPEKLSRAILRLLRDDKLMHKLSENAKHTAMTQFSMEGQVEKIRSIIESTVSP